MGYLEVNMKKGLSITLKVLFFLAGLYALMAVVAFFARNDVDAYTRVLMKELHEQEAIDIVFAGASHVSHGLSPKGIEKELGIKSFCTGTPNQRIGGTEAIIGEVLSLYHPKEVWLEFDFAVMCEKTQPLFARSISKSTFLSTYYLKNAQVKRNFFKKHLSPKYYLNFLIPLGRETLLDLNPKSLFKVAKAKLSGTYATKKPAIIRGTYEGAGCVLDEEIVETGSLWTKGEKSIPVEDFGAYVQETILDIKKVLDAQGIKLVCYQNPSTPFYLIAKGRYGEYTQKVRDFCEGKLGVPYYDFSLAKSEFETFRDEDFSDDNHLNFAGIEKFSKAWARWKKAGQSSEVFYKTFEEKLDAAGPKVYGLLIKEREDKKGFALGAIAHKTGTLKEGSAGEIANIAEGKKAGEGVLESTEGDDFALEYFATATLADGSKVELEKVGSDEVGVQFLYPQHFSGFIECRIKFRGEVVAKAKKNFVAM